MPKFKKESISKQKKGKKRKISDEEFILKSIYTTAILAGVFLIISLFLNGTEEYFNGILIKVFKKEMIVETADNTKINISEILDNTIKVAVILLFFFFSFVSLANYKELTGKPTTLTQGIFLGLLALLQTIRLLWVFLFTLIGIILILIYLYFIQDY
ncbi:MAG: hypothetical protein ACTSR8_18740 [Promethearchaeota archaeon]